MSRSPINVGGFVPYIGSSVQRNNPSVTLLCANGANETPYCAQSMGGHARSLFYARLLFLCVAVMWKPLSVRAQASTETFGSRTPSGTSTESDPQAVQLLTQTLVGLGGEAAWTNVHSLRVSGVIKSALAGPARQFEWNDDWSGQVLRSSRQMTSTSGAISSSRDGTRRRSVLIRGATVPVKELSIVASLARQVPAVSIMLALQRSVYDLKRDATSSTSDLTCIEVGTGSRTILKWYVSSATGSLDHAQVAVPDQMNHDRYLWQTITYHGFTSNGGISFPSSESVQLGNAPPSLINFQSFTINPTASATDSTGVHQ